ncbi:MAG: 6-bladed beta-propeller [bacterium]|nr:6-bladed beta-propeller [bacterium]
MGKLKILVLSMIYMSTFFNCASEPETYTVEVIDGVRHVHNLAPQWGDEPEAGLEFVQMIGGIDALDENYQLYEIEDVLSDENGNIYVLDGGNDRIQKFDSAGKYLLTIGRKGQGPGEFNTAKEIDIYDDMIYIREASKISFEIFDLEGNFVNSYQGKYNKTRFRMMGKDRYFLRKPFVTGDEKYVFEVMDEKGEVISEFGVPLRIDNDDKVGDYNTIAWRSVIKANDVFLDTDLSHNLYAVYRCQNRIEKYSHSGDLLMKIDRPVDFEIVNKVEAQEWAGETETRKFYTYSLTPVSERIGVDESGRIWVATFTAPIYWDNESMAMKVPGITFEVFDNEGILLGRVPFPDTTWELIRICGNNVYFCDPEFISIYHYRIVD